MLKLERMGTLGWDLGPTGFSDANEQPPQLTVCCTYPNTSLPPTCITFRLSPRYAIHSAREAHDWFLSMMREHEEFEVETDEAGELALGFGSETVRQVVVE